MARTHGQVCTPIPTSPQMAMFACLNVSFGAFPEMQAVLDGRAVAYKLSRAGLLDEAFYVLSVFLTHLPRAAANSLVLSCIVYWMADFVPEFERAAFFFLIVLGVELAVAGIDRVLSFALPTVEQAQSATGLLTSIFLLMGGFLATRTNIPWGMRWCYWISPFSWGLRSLAINEFASARYRDPLYLVDAASADVTAGVGDSHGGNGTGLIASVPRVNVTTASTGLTKGDAYLDVFEI